MSTTVIILLAMLACSIIAGALFWYVSRQRSSLSKSLPFVHASSRQLSEEERVAIERYLTSLSQHQRVSPPGSTPEPLSLASYSHQVYPVTHTITRYGLSTDDPYKWRYYLDAVEIHLPPLWEQYITDENYVELIRTQTMPLVISLNGHQLTQYDWDTPILLPTVHANGKNAAILKAESEQIELLNVRKESREEYELSRPEGIREALMAGMALLLFFFSLLSPLLFMPWLATLATVLLLSSGWLLYRSPREKDLKEIHCLRGAPKRWGLFGESHQGQLNHISLGSLDLIYPSHWQNYVEQDLGKTTEIDIYLNRHVVRQGPFLSLQDEARNFPIQRWKKNIVLAACSLIVLILLIGWLPLSMPLKMTLAWAKGTDNLEVSQVAELEKTPLVVGDKLTVKGTGMCSIPASYQGNRNYAFMPFDCSALYWNNAPALPLPQSDIIDQATALLESTHQQLHPQEGSGTKLNPQLATAIQKSGMILLSDFADIVRKTQDLCSQKQDCVRLKNALVNLGNAKNWTTLVKRANSGRLKGMNVLLRPVSADILENLVNSATATFFSRETRQAINMLNSPPPGGFVIFSDEGHSLVSHPVPAISLFDYSAPEQWPALQHLAGMLLHTPFTARGIITNITTDANGTQHIALHSEPDSLTLWRYFGSSLLLLVLLLTLAGNVFLTVRRIYRNRLRLLEIQHYYDTCLNHTLSKIHPLRSMF